MTVDPITLEVIRNRLIAASGDIRRVVERAAYSPVLYEVIDFSCALLDAEANLVAETPGLPIFLANLTYSVRSTYETIGRENLKPGDVILCNDPYNGGFTHCPDVCPSTLYDLQLVHKGVRQDSGNGPPSHQVLFVSVDPERDTPEKLGEYVSYFDPDFIGVTGSQQQLAPLTRQLGIAYRIEEHEAGSAQYGVDHSASILVTDPEGRLHGVFPAPHDAGTIVEDLSTVLD